MMVTDQDYELLSGYIDNALTAAERQALEARLAAEPALRAELEALRGTVALLRGMPVFKAPRDFTLTPAMVARPEPMLDVVPKRRAQPFYLSPVFSAAAAAAAFLLVALSTVLLNLDSPLRESAPAAIALQATVVVSAQFEALITATPPGSDTVAGAAAARPTQTASVEQETQDAAIPLTADPNAMLFSSEAAATALPEAGMQMAPAGAADSAQEEALTFTPEIAPLNFAAPAGTLPPPVDGIITGSAADSAPATASMAREGDPGTATPAPTQPAMLAATMAPQGTPVAVLPPAVAAPVPSPATTTSSSPFVPLVLLGAGVLLGLLAILTTLLRRRAK
jgi:anti-sigma factor RsiW